MPYDIAWGNVDEHFTNIPTRMIPSNEVSIHPSEGKKGMYCFDVMLEKFIDCIRRCAISRIIEIRWLRMWSAAGGECCA